jgi:hypothetical protein
MRCLYDLHDFEYWSHYVDMLKPCFFRLLLNSALSEALCLLLRGFVQVGVCALGDKNLGLLKF